MKPRIGKPMYCDDYWKFFCRGTRSDGTHAYGFGHTMEQAYNEWLAYKESDIPF
jgi:hypothetical protein